MDPSVEIREQGPGRGVEEDDGQSEERGDDEHAAHDQGVDAQTRGDAGGHAAQPPLGTGDAEAGDPEEEAIRAARDGPPRGAGSRVGMIGGWRGRSGNRHASILAVALGARPWGKPLSAP
nr:hypothetical protein [Microbacterium barkeri]